MSLRAAWNLMRDVEIDTLCIVDSDNELRGLITIKDIADANMDLFDTAVLAAANTRCTNLLETLEGLELVVGSADAHIDSGNLCISHQPGNHGGARQARRPCAGLQPVRDPDVRHRLRRTGHRCLLWLRGAAHHRGTCAGKGLRRAGDPYDTYAAAPLISTAAPVHRYAHEGIAEIQRKYAID